jgi:hypothetical protein
VDFACRIVAEMIADTARYDTPRREGLRLEKNLFRLLPDQPGTAPTAQNESIFKE